MRKLDKSAKLRLLYTALVAILVFDALYAVITVHGPTNLGEDDSYIERAFNVIHGQLNISFDSGYRPMQYLPIAAFYELFGINTYTSSAWNIIAFVGSVLLAFLIGKEVYSANVGVLSSLLMSFFIIVVKDAATTGVEVAMMFLVSLAMLALLYGRKRSSKKWMFAAGALFVAAPLTIPIGLVAVVAGTAYVLIELARKRIKLNLVAYLLVGMVAASMMVFAFGYIVANRPFAIVTATYANVADLNFTNAVYGIIGTQPAWAPGDRNDLFGFYLPFYPEQMFTYYTFQALFNELVSNNITLASIWQQLASPGLNTGFYFDAAVIAIAYLLIRRDRRLYFPMVWFGMGIIFLQFFPQSINLSPFRYELIFRDTRYLTSIAVPTCVIISMALARAVGTMRKRTKKSKGGTWRRNAGWATKLTLASAAVLFLILTSLPANLFWYNFVYTEYYSMNTIAHILTMVHSNTVVYYPSGDYPRMLIYTGDSRFLYLVTLDSITNCSQFLAGSYVIIPNATINFAPQWPYITNTSKYCPNLHLVAAPYSNAFGQENMAFKNQQKLYYVAPS